MKKLFLFYMLFIAIIGVIAQDESEKTLTKQEQKALKKALKAKEDSIAAADFALTLESKQWVLEADRVSFNSGKVFNVSQTLNFIAIEGEEAFVQIGSMSAYGYNGVGGISIKGIISRYEQKITNKYGSSFIAIIVNSSIGTFDIRISVNSDGEMANATVQGATTSGQIKYDGRIVKLSESTVYKGRAIF